MAVITAVLPFHQKRTSPVDRQKAALRLSHLARQNPHGALIAEGRETIAVFYGPYGYISSSWYPLNPVRDSAPTWNFAVVHCHGRPVPRDDHGTARHLLRLVDVLEGPRRPLAHARARTRRHGAAHARTSLASTCRSLGSRPSSRWGRMNGSTTEAKRSKRWRRANRAPASMMTTHNAHRKD
jgi:transcriptional regulator